MRLEPVSADLQKCAALVIDREHGTFACSIYEIRPDVCRDLLRGSGECRGEIAGKGERLRRALVVVM